MEWKVKPFCLQLVEQEKIVWFLFWYPYLWIHCSIHVEHVDDCMENIYFNMLLLLFENNFFYVFNSFFQWGWLHRNIFFNLGEMNFSVSSPRPTEKNMCFSVRLFLFLCGLTHRKISFNLGEHNFSVRVRPTEKLFLTVNPQKN